MTKTDLPPAPTPNILFQINTTPAIPVLPVSKERDRIDIRYPLLEPYAYAHIFWDHQGNELVYVIEEPELTDAEKDLLETIERGIEELINISFLNVKTTDAVVAYLEKNIKVLLAELGIKVTQEVFLRLMYYVYRDFVGLNEIEPLMKDYFIEDIECNGVDTPVYIVHRKYRNLRTNIVFHDVDHLASFVEKLAQKCGKYISYANPIIDAQLPDKSRINATFTQEISSRGPTFSIRKFTTEPWSPVKLIQFKTLSPEMLAYFWIMIEHEANFVIIGGTGSGKTSLLNALAFFIPPAARVVSIEDTREINLVHENWLPSVSREAIGVGEEGKFGEIDLFTLLRASFRQRPDYVIVGEIRGSIHGNEEVVIVEKGITKRVPIKSLEGKDLQDIYVPTLNKELRVSLTKLKDFIKHPPRNKLIEVITRSGRRVTVTGDHSLFTAKGLQVKPVEAKNLAVGDRVVIPHSMPFGYNDVSSILLTDYIQDIQVANVQSLVKKAMHKLGQKQANVVCGCIARQYCRKKQITNIPFKLFDRLMQKANMKYDVQQLKVKRGGGRVHNNTFKINEDFLRFLGYYLAEGHLEGNGTVVITNSNKKIIEDVKKISQELFGIDPSCRDVFGYGKSKHITICSALLYRLIISLGCGKTHNKRVPSFVYGTPKKKICALLKGIYSGDGSFYKNELSFDSKLRKLVEDVTYLLLSLGIVGRISKNKTKYRVRFKRIEDARRFLDEVGFVHHTPTIIKRGPAHTAGNSVHLTDEALKELKLTRKFRHLRKYNQCSKYYLQEVVKELNIKDESVLNFANGEFYIDRVKEINEIALQTPEPVYDLSVNPTENFIGGFGGIILHNSEANVLFQGSASGHPSACTMHAEDVDTMIKRLETPPISLSPSLVETIDIVCIISQVKVKGEDVRRVKSIVEIIKVDENGNAVTNAPFVWDPASDGFFFKTESVMFQKLVSEYGLNMNHVLREFNARTKLLYELYRRGITDYKAVQEIINAYYTSPEEVLKRFNVQ